MLYHTFKDDRIMKAKYKMTGCARFLIFLIILIPIAYFGSKYLRDSGTWDKIKDKVENSDQSSVERAIENRKERIDPGSLQDLDSDERYGRLRRAYEEQEDLIREQEQTIAQLRKEIEDLKTNQASISNERVTVPPTQSEPQRPSNTNNDGTPSLDDLLREADMQPTETTTAPPPNTSSSRQTIGRWNFTYSGARGEIEMYQQNGRLLSRITVEGSNSVSVDELRRTGQDRFDVVNSPTGEYYILRSNNDLDAYDSNGFQTTCRYIN